MKKGLIELTKEYIDSLDEGMMDASFDRLKLIQKKYSTPERLARSNKHGFSMRRTERS